MPEAGFNSAALKIELFCRGIKLDPSLENSHAGRRISRTRAGLGSGLELVIPGREKDYWVNVPILEPFVQPTPFRLIPRGEEGLTVHDTRDGRDYPVELPPEPAWYSKTTARGTPMARIGVLQGTYLGIYVSNTCQYWTKVGEPENCKFCTSGLNVGTAESLRKDVDDIVEVAKAARAESGTHFVHFNCGYSFEDDPRRERSHGLMQAAPFVQALRDEVGGFIGVQAVPVLKENYHEYDQLIELGCDHFSFCFEFYDPEYFAKYCPGKARTVGLQSFLDAMDYTSRKLGRGRVAGEIIAGVEPIEATKRAIDRITQAGAFPTVCIFRPVIGSLMQEMPSPDPEQMKEVMGYMYDSCRRNGVPVGVLPGIEVSLVVTPEEGKALATAAPGWPDWYELKRQTLKKAAIPYAKWKDRPRDPKPAAAS